MDIVSRLKRFILQLETPVTQFADNCHIPRPTLSQLLNGRNKTVRDELIAKIHEAYPQLSVMWLMFGEGDMLTAPLPGKASHQDGQAEQLPFDDIDLHESLSDTTMESASLQPAVVAGTGTALPIDFTIDANPVKEEKAESTSKAQMPSELKELQRTISFNNSEDGSKRVVNIIVYYSDNTFQSFIPDPNS